MSIVLSAESETALCSVRASKNKTYENHVSKISTDCGNEISSVLFRLLALVSVLRRALHQSLTVWPACCSARTGAAID